MSPKRSPRYLVALLFVALLAAIVPMPTAASAAPARDPRAEREKIRSQKAAVAADVNALQADDAQVSAALQALNDNVRGQQAAFSDAQAAATDAQQHAEEATAAVTAKEAEITQLRNAISEFAVNAYVNPPTEEFLDGFREDSAGEAVRKKSLLSFRSGRDTDLLDQLKSAEAELKSAQTAAREAQAAADARVGVLAEQLTQLQDAQAQQQQFADEVESRLDAKLAEAAGLAESDSALSAEISKQEATIAAQLKAMAKSSPAPSRSTSSGSSAGGSSSGGGGGSSAGPITSVPGAPGLTTVGGITVNSRIASNLQGLMTAASAAGFNLSGGGYRDSSNQIALRRQNCGSSDYAVYQMPASQCSPETARPGLSKHEQGLAVDFQVNGGSLSYGSSAHQWMQANAGKWGWIPLAGEPWHWSVS